MNDFMELHSLNQTDRDRESLVNVPELPVKDNPHTHERWIGDRGVAVITRAAKDFYVLTVYERPNQFNITDPTKYLCQVFGLNFVESPMRTYRHKQNAKRFIERNLI